MFTKNIVELHNQNIEVKILTVNTIDGKILNPNWKKYPMQVITFKYNGNLLAAIDNIPGIQNNQSEWIGKHYKAGEIIKAFTKINSNYLWINNLLN
jgi:hypothetical protein